MGHKKEAGKKIFDRSASLSSTTGNGAVPNGGNRKKPDPFHRAQSKKSNLPTSTNNIDGLSKNVDTKSALNFASNIRRKQTS